MNNQEMKELLKKVVTLIFGDDDHFGMEDMLDPYYHCVRDTSDFEAIREYKETLTC